MDQQLLNIVTATFSISLLSFIGIVVFLIKEKILQKLSLYLVAFSAGALIGGAFFHLLPEATAIQNELYIYGYLVLGIILFFVIERFLKWRHCHEQGECDVHTFTYMSLLGDGVHNLIDGLIIASAFMISGYLGVVTTIAVAAHELPQELGDFGVLIHGGFSRTKALLWNFFSGITAIFGGIIGYFLINNIQNVTLFLLPFAAGGFIYVALSDLIPEIHSDSDPKRSFINLSIFLLGLLFMVIMKIYLGE